MKDDTGRGRRVRRQRAAAGRLVRAGALPGAGRIPQLFLAVPAKRTREDPASAAGDARWASCRRPRRPASSDAAGNCWRSNGCSGRNGTPSCAARVARARRPFPRSSRGGWSGPTRCGGRRSCRSRRTSTWRAVVDRSAGNDRQDVLGGRPSRRRRPADRARRAGTGDAPGVRQHGEHPPLSFASEGAPALSDEAHEDLREILDLCAHLMAIGDTRVVFTSRKALPLRSTGHVADASIVWTRPTRSSWSSGASTPRAIASTEPPRRGTRLKASSTP